MKSTKDTVRHYIVLSVAPTVGRAGELQRFEYVEGDQFKTRRAAIRHAETARMRWADNYHQYRDAKFALTDTADIERTPPQLPGKHVSRGDALKARLRYHVSGAITRGTAQAIIEQPAPTNDWPANAKPIIDGRTGKPLKRADWERSNLFNGDQ